VRQLLAHQAGVVALDAPAATDLFYDWDAMCSRLAAQPPAWEPGTAHGESALFHGHLVAELVRRVDGRGIGGFLCEDVCVPLGWTSPSAWARPTRPARLRSPDSTTRAGSRELASLSTTGG
jgi:CubicO group peptidase (beta-lactamase class C family)